MIRRRLFLLVLLLALGAGVLAQGEGTGVVREGTTQSVESLVQFNPLLCENFTCIRLNDFIAPRLLYVDPETVRIDDAPAGSNALVASWSTSVDGRTYTFSTRTDLTWEDGSPVTAYDALYTLGVLTAGRAPSRTYYNDEGFGDIESIAAPDATTLVVERETATCETLDLLDIPLIPYAAFDPDYPSALDEAGSPPSDHDYRLVRFHPYSAQPWATSESTYTLSEARPPDYLRLVSPDGARAYEFVPIPPNSGGDTAAFLREDINYNHNFPYSSVADQIAIGGTVAGGVNTFNSVIYLNLADPTEPRPWDTDEPEGQGEHPVWADERVREAAALAIDYDKLIEAGRAGYGEQSPTVVVPGAWYENQDIQPTPYDFDRARRLLEDAGWRDGNGDGVRECIQCDTAPQDTRLQITLTSEDSVMSGLVAGDWRRAGFDVQINGAVGLNQTTDATLIVESVGYPYNPVTTFAPFETENDTISLGGTNIEGPNISSYSNPRVDNLLDDARTMQNCADTDLRAAYYRDAARLIAEDHVAIPLIAPHRVYAVGPGVQGFAPLPGAPQWNIQNWTITGGTP